MSHRVALTISDINLPDKDTDSHIHKPSMINIRRLISYGRINYPLFYKVKGLSDEIVNENCSWDCLSYMCWLRLTWPHVSQTESCQQLWNAQQFILANGYMKLSIQYVTKLTSGQVRSELCIFNCYAFMSIQIGFLGLFLTNELKN